MAGMIVPIVGFTQGVTKAIGMTKFTGSAVKDSRPETGILWGSGRVWGGVKGSS